MRMPCQYLGGKEFVARDSCPVCRIMWTRKVTEVKPETRPGAWSGRAVEDTTKQSTLE